MLARFALLLITLLAVPVIVTPAVSASPADHYSGPYFGEDNFPPGCIRDMSVDNPDNICHHMRTGLNALDSPQIDVAILVPVSPTAERDMRIMRQSIEMWDGGLDYLSREMGLDWLADGVDFHVTVDYIDLEGDGDGGEFTTYPIVDPEIVVIATNPVGGIGIGVDPVDFVFTDSDLVPCHGVDNPFDFEYWDNLPGFDSHHEARSGTYTEDCGGSGGNICFAINGAIDPAPETIDFFNLFDLVSHEVGHCLTLGHVGDGAEGTWGRLPSNDIMAYSADPPGLNKCVSTLDVEGFAIRMSNYLDVNSDGVIDGGDVLLANDQIGQGGNAFQVQHPDDHHYASSTGSPMDCPQPDLGPVPGERTDWTPTPAETTENVLTVTGPDDGTVTQDGTVTVTGTVEQVDLRGDEEQPASSTGSYDDADDDASSALTEILSLDVAATDSHVTATISLAELWPSTDLASATSYSVSIDGRQFDSFIRYPVDANPQTWDNGAGAYMPAGTSSWDLDAKAVTFEIPRDYLATAGIEAPYFVGSSANFGSLSAVVVDDTAPEDGDTVGVAGARVVDAGGLTGSGTTADPFTRTDTFFPEQSTFGVTPFLGLDSSHVFELDVEHPSRVEFTLAWTDDVGGADLDLYVTGVGDSGTDGATVEMPEQVVLDGVQGRLNLRVEPYFVTDPVNGSTYTLTAVVTPYDDGTDRDGDGVSDVEDECPDEPGTAPSGCPDRDGDGVPDTRDTCPDTAGNGADGCPIEATEHVHVYVDGVLAASQDVDTANGPDSFAIPVGLDEGSHELRIVWEDEGQELATSTRTVTYEAADTGGEDDRRDRDADGVADYEDNCPSHANADQADLDGDGRGDVCDSDTDGDGHSDQKEEAHGTDPEDPGSYPGKGRG